MLDATARDLPLGFKQRLALACALMHEPDILFLDEPTSGVDPLARREFWRRINALAEAGVTVLVTTHFMEEAEYCDRLVIMANGQVLTEGAPESDQDRRAPPRPTGSDHGGRVHLGDRGGQRAGGGMNPPLRRLLGLMRKEFLQIGRDPSALAVAFVLPAFLLLIFGYGVSLDARNVPLALVVERPDALAASFTSQFARSPYLPPAPIPRLSRSAERAMAAREVDAIVWLRSDFTRRADSSRLVADRRHRQRRRRQQRADRRGLCPAGLEQLAGRARPGGRPALADCRSPIQPQVRFNPAVSSRDYLVPGLIAMIMTLTGALLTALVIAREWERGTMEALMVTRVRMSEILLAKLVPYFLLGMGGMAASVALAVFLFGVPLHGSILVLTGASALFMLAALGMGLLISGVARNQFVAGQIAIITTFLPAFILSGFVFDINSMPHAVQIITHIVAARYFVAILQSVFLAGDVWSVILPNAAALAVMAAIFLGARARDRAQAAGLSAMWRQVLALILKELLAVLRDTRSRMVLIGPPLIQLMVFGYAATFDLNHVPIAIYDQDRSQASRDLVARFSGSPTFTVVAALDSAQRIDALIDSRQVQMVLVIDRRFTRDLLTHQPAPVQLILDGRNSNTALLIEGYASTDLERFRPRLGRRARGAAPPAVLDVRTRYNPTLVRAGSSCQASSRS